MMTDRQKFDRLLQVYATIQPYRAPDFSNGLVTEFWFREFGMVPVEQMRNCLDYWIRNETHFPSVSDIRKTLGVHEADPEVEARQISGRVIQAISKYGWCNATQAQEFVGELGWHVVACFGGWMTLCETTTANMNQLSAQMREFAKSAIISKRFPQNENYKTLLPEGTKKAIELAFGNSATIDKAKEHKRIGNSENNHKLVGTE
jgi:hypothetical protein